MWLWQCGWWLVRGWRLVLWFVVGVAVGCCCCWLVRVHPQEDKRPRCKGLREVISVGGCSNDHTCVEVPFKAGLLLYNVLCGTRQVWIEQKGDKSRSLKGKIGHQAKYRRWRRRSVCATSYGRRRTGTSFRLATKSLLVLVVEHPRPESCLFRAFGYPAAF